MRVIVKFSDQNGRASVRKRRRFLMYNVLLSVLTALWLCLSPANIARAESVSVPLGPSDPAELEVFLDDFITTQLQTYQIPGAAVAVVVDGELFFFINNDNTALELWKSDGTEAGTVFVKNLSSSGITSLNFQTQTAVNGLLFFSYDDGINGFELWRSDGTEAGTFMAKDIHTSGSSNPCQMKNVNGVLYFQANDGYWIAGATASALNPTAFETIWVEIMDGALYTYEIAGDANSFLATATANLDDDGTIDTWTINDAGTLTKVIDDTED